MEFVLKVEGGKLFRIRGDAADGRISRVVITGDFFLHPEEAIESLESALEGVSLERDAVLAVVTRELSKATLVGASVEDITDLVIMLSGR